MTIEQKITTLIEATVNSLEYELVRVKQIGNDVIQIMIDKDSGVSIDDCAKLTRLVSRILQVAEISDSYRLEVSSPGLDRPLLKPEHFTKFVGNEIKLTAQVLIDGQKRFIGKLTNFNVETQQITLVCESKVITIDFNQIESANLYYKG
jgi:ribosome maturation factor RimP